MMGKIALLVSREEMLYQAHNILQEKQYGIGEMKVIRTEDAVSEARRSIAGGASIIIARGLQASLIKQYTDIPVVEIVITAQEMALLVMRAKQILKKDSPVIAVVGFRNMFCDMSYFDMIYGIELRTYYADKGAYLKSAAEQAVQDGADLIIGGDTAVGVAGKAGVPSLFLSITEDSLRNAFAMAESMEYAMGTQKRSEAQLETLLDNSFSGVVRMDRDGKITDVNPIMEDILGKPKAEVLGIAAGEVFRELDAESLRQVLQEGGGSYSLFLQKHRAPIFAVVAPVVVDGRADGAIMTCHRVKHKQTTEQESQRRRHSKGFIALGEFDDIVQKSKAMQECVRLAKLYALSEKPVLIMGEAGTEKRLLAQSIHNAGMRGGGPFVDISCDGIRDEEQLEMIFGDRGAVAQAKGGSVLIGDVCCLTRANQYRLYQLIRYKLRVGKDVVQYPNVDVRVMVTAKTSLAQLVGEGKLMEELYYLLEGLTVRVPPLRERKEDLEWKIEESIRECCGHYSRYHVLTQGAKKLLMEYPWEGNLFQVENFCERLVLTADRRSLDELAVSRLLKELYPGGDHAARGRAGDGNRGLGGSVRSRDSELGGSAGNGWLPEEAVRIQEEAMKIRETLERMAGNRERTARELGISKATLWRKMKKYGVE